MSASSKIKAKIGQQLLAAGLLSETQLEAALEYQRENGGFIGDALVRMGLVRADLVGQMLAASMGVDYVNLAGAFLDPDVFDLVGEDYQRRNSLLPFKLVDATLHVAMSDPLNVKVTDHLHLMTGLRIAPTLALYDDIQEAFTRAYTVKHAADSVLREIQDAADEPAEADLSAAELANLAEDAPIVRLANSMLVGAVNIRASDIHIEPQAKSVRVRYRVDGALYEQMCYAPSLHPAVVSRIKIMSHLNIVERRRPQDGRINLALDGAEIDLRVSTMPMLHGEKVVMRVLDKAGARARLDDLGFYDDQVAVWRRFLKRPYGMILVTGPTGAGKSTTLYASLNEINDSERNILTVEDPIEYCLDGVNQSQVNSKIGVTFASALRAIVRQDPDVILVGEIRDVETAEIAIQAALTGHLVLSTLHTNDAPGALVRLDNMGVERFLITSAVIGVVGQRLLRRVCTACAVPEEADPEAVELLGIKTDRLARATLRRGQGCAKCAGRGYKGRVAVYEVMPVTGRMREALRRNVDGAILKQIALDDGMVPMQESAIRRALAGDTTLDEVVRVLLSEQDEETAAALQLAA